MLREEIERKNISKGWNIWDKIETKFSQNDFESKMWEIKSKLKENKTKLRKLRSKMKDFESKIKKTQNFHPF